MNILEAKGIGHDFRGRKVLTNVDLEVMPGERHAIIGPNGAGKTTLFNILTGTYRPSRGKVFFKGRNVTGYAPHTLTRLGMGRSFQVTSTFPRLTVFQNIRLGVLSRRGIRFNMFQRIDKLPDITAEAEAILARIDLQDVRDMPAIALSYGKHRVLELGLALTTAPDLVFLDDPTAGMARDEARLAVDLIRELTEGRTLVLSGHDLEAVFALAERITVLNRGMVLITGSPEEIRENRSVKEAYLAGSCPHA